MSIEDFIEFVQNNKGFVWYEAIFGSNFKAEYDADILNHEWVKSEAFGNVFYCDKCDLNVIVSTHIKRVLVSNSCFNCLQLQMIKACS